MQSALSIFNLNNIARMTAENNIDLAKLGYGDKPVAIFIGIPYEDKSNHFIATCFVSQIYRALTNLSRKGTGKLKRKVKFILNEFGNMPPIEGFDNFVTVCLGMGISFDIYTQSLNQIEKLYGDGSKTIHENLANQIYIKSIGQDTAEEFSRMLGDKTMVEITRHGKRMSLSRSYTENAVARPLMTAAELTELYEGECIIYRGIKRTDLQGKAITNYPIINEYADRVSLKTRFWILKKFFSKWKKSGFNKALDMLKSNINLGKIYEGTALLYRYQLL